MPLDKAFHFLHPKDRPQNPYRRVSRTHHQRHPPSKDLIAVGGFIHDVSQFIDEHPGGRALISPNQMWLLRAARFFGCLFRYE
ncbi:hypothetical protein PtB15_7B146 [Puccinia triticina]|nr:hypothetical protein PtB15_7B146 [Puccinia triticina]